MNQTVRVIKSDLKLHHCTLSCMLIVVAIRMSGTEHAALDSVKIVWRLNKGEKYVRFVMWILPQV